MRPQPRRTNIGLEIASYIYNKYTPTSTARVLYIHVYKCTNTNLTVAESTACIYIYYIVYVAKIYYTYIM